MAKKYKVEKRGNNYRFKKMINGVNYSMTYDHNPSDREIEIQIAEWRNNIVTKRNMPKQTFRKCAEEFINIQDKILSVSTIRNYKIILKMLPDNFKDIKMEDVDSIAIQRVINDISEERRPKTVKNYYAFIAAVMHKFNNSFSANVRLPQLEENNYYVPTKEEVDAVLSVCEIDYMRNVYELACMGLRKSEILALTIDDVHDNYVEVKKAKVKAEVGWAIKLPKTVKSTREVPISEDLSKRIKTVGYIYQGDPDKILDYLYECQEKVNSNRFTLHGLRHYFATELDQAGFSNKDIQNLGGWSSSVVLKKHYLGDRVDEEKKKEAVRIITGKKKSEDNG